MEKKFYSKPTCKVVTLDSDDIVCTSPGAASNLSGDNDLQLNGRGSGSNRANDRGGIWDED